MVKFYSHNQSFWRCSESSMLWFRETGLGVFPYHNHRTAASSSNGLQCWLVLSHSHRTLMVLKIFETVMLAYKNKEGTHRRLKCKRSQLKIRKTSFWRSDLDEFRSSTEILLKDAIATITPFIKHRWYRNQNSLSLSWSKHHSRENLILKAHLKPPNCKFY